MVTADMLFITILLKKNRNTIMSVTTLKNVQNKFIQMHEQSNYLFCDFYKQRMTRSIKHNQNSFNK